MKKMLVIDGNSVINRAFYGVRPLSTREGIPTNAIFGYVNILLKNLESVSPDYAAVAFDLKAPTFRHKMYGQYKAGRRPTPPELLSQFPYAKEVSKAMGLSVVSLEGYEADDILGTLSRMGNESGVEVYLLTGDRDSLQLIGDNTKVLLATNTDTVLTGREEFRAKYTVEPEQFVDVKALMGDSSDNIPGVAGIGEKGAVKLIYEAGSLEKLYASLDEMKLSPALRQKLETGRESAFLSQKLARIEREAPLGIELADIEYKGIDKQALYPLFTKLEFFAFLKRLGLSEYTVAGKSEKTEYKETDGGTLLSLDRTCVYAIDPDIENGKLYVSGEGTDLCVPIGEAARFLSDPSFKKAVYDAKRLYTLFDGEGAALEGVAFDCLLATYLLKAGESVGDLGAAATSYLNEAYTGECGGASNVIYRLYKAQQTELVNKGMDKLANEIELPTSRVLFNMEKRGFKIETEGLKKYGERLEKAEETFKENIYIAAGCEFNINSPKQLGEILFEKMGFPAVKKTKTGYSTSAEVLEKLRPYAPIIDDILDYRAVAKLRSTYVDGLLAACDENKRVHTVFKQALTATGRLSSTEPNLQNIPIRTELGRELRRFFIADGDDRVLIDADYSQIELRLLAHISGDETMREAFRNETDIHSLTASQAFRVPLSAVTPEMRKKAKAVNFGIIYGMGDFSLASDIHVTKKEAAEYIKSYFEKYPKVDEYLKNTVKEAYEKGYVETLFGRRRAIPELTSQKAMMRKFGERVAMNSPIQGTAADIIKLAMINTERALGESGLDAVLIMQVHDELIVESSKKDADEAMELLRREMENAVSLSVPLTVDVHKGRSWFDCK